MIKVLVFIAFTLVSFTATAEGDVEAGKQKAVICASCHGQQGISLTDIWPNLAGQKQGYLVKQMMDYRAGNRSDPSMDAMMKMLSDDDVKNIAAYYSSLPGCSE